jgi:hypothetical protein
MAKKGKPSRRALTDERERELVVRYLAGESASKLAEAFSVSPKTVDNIRRRHGVTASQRRSGPDSRGGRAGAIPGPAPSDWDALVADITEPPDDPMEWAGWVRTTLTKVAQYRLHHPDLPERYVETLAEYRQTLRDAMGVRQEDLLADTLAKIKADLEELEDTGPEVTTLAPRRHRRDRKSPPS